MRLTSQCPLYFSWQPDPYTMATNAFLQSWKVLKAYTNPPWNLIGRVLAQVESHIVLAAPVWRAQPWFPMLLGMLIDYPRQMPPGVEITSNLHPALNMPKLAVWPISGKNTETSNFQGRLRYSSWRTKTNKSYDFLFGKGHSWCSQRSFDPFSGPVVNVANFLAYLYKEGYQYSSINAYRSAISSVHEQVDGHNVGQHPIITKGIFNVRPLLPWYTCTWSVQIILNHIESLGDNKQVVLKHLSLKLTMLLALTLPSMSADFSQTYLDELTNQTESVFTLVA